MADFVQGWTSRIKYTVYTDGAVQDLTAMSVQLVAYDRTDSPVSFVGTVGIATPASGLVYFDPSDTDLLKSKSPYSIRWKVTDSNGRVAFFPSGAPEVWYVRSH